MVEILCCRRKAVSALKSRDFRKKFLLLWEGRISPFPPKYVFLYINPLLGAFRTGSDGHLPSGLMGP